MKKPIIVLTGPTAVGKTEISIELAKAAGVKLFQLIRCKYTNRWILELQKLKKSRCRALRTI